MRPLARVGLRLALLAITLTAPATLGAQPVDVPEPTDSTQRVLVARRATGPLRMDSRIHEADWRTAPVATDFMQARPDYVPTTENENEVRVLFDDEHLYIGAFNREVLGRRGLRVTDLRRDFGRLKLTERRLDHSPTATLRILQRSTSPPRETCRPGGSPLASTPSTVCSARSSPRRGRRFLVPHEPLQERGRPVEREQPVAMVERLVQIIAA
jgi:hypothetical protein